jgi:hypothetical protein
VPPRFYASSLMMEGCCELIILIGVFLPLEIPGIG